MESFIRDMLKRAINEDMVESILDNSMDKFVAAFTSKEYNPEENYEFFEQLGDLSINKFIVSYMGKRFPHLRSSNGVGVLASLRILYGSKEKLSSLSEYFGMDKYIKCTLEEKMDKNKFKNVLEDVFEAFFGALEFIIDQKWYEGMGYIFVFKLLENIFDKLDISIEYESLVDAKTRLNELKDEHKLIIKYNDTKLDDGYFKTELYINNVLAGVGVSNVKKNSQIMAAQEGLKWIKTNLNIEKEVPERYKNLPGKIW